MTSVTPGLVESGLIDQGQDDATKDAAHCIGVAGHQVDAKGKVLIVMFGHVGIIFAPRLGHKGD
jgi:hypothetical protein